jgi:hypothetical protein
MTAMISRTTPTHSRKFSDCTSPPVTNRITAITATIISKVFISGVTLLLLRLSRGTVTFTVKKVCKSRWRVVTRGTYAREDGRSARCFGSRNISATAIGCVSVRPSSGGETRTLIGETLPLSETSKDKSVMVLLDRAESNQRPGSGATT